MIKYKVYWLAVLLSLMLSPFAQASIEGTWASNGILNVTFSKPAHQPVITASNLNESWVFNADKTFTRGGILTGIWKQKPDKPGLFVAVYDLSGYADHLTNFWADRGVAVSNVRILRSILQIREVSNGLSGEELLKYNMDVTESGKVRKTTVVIRGSFFAPNGANENTALSQIFPTMSQGQSSAASSSYFTNATQEFTGSFSIPDTVPISTLIETPDTISTPIEPQ
ncbi:MAG TPA: hypothetical protein VIJ25_12570 [Methylococcales bacterium]